MHNKAKRMGLERGQGTTKKGRGSLNKSRV